MRLISSIESLISNWIRALYFAVPVERKVSIRSDTFCFGGYCPSLMHCKHLTRHFHLLTDDFSPQDIQLTVCNDDQYFLFEDILYQVISRTLFQTTNSLDLTNLFSPKVMLCFSRDLAVADAFYGNSSNPLVATLKGKSTVIGNSVIYPPNGVIPFHGFTMYGNDLQIALENS